MDMADLILKNQKLLVGSSLAGIISTPIAVSVIDGSVNILLMSIIVELLIVITAVLVYVLLNQLIPTYGVSKVRPYFDPESRERLNYIIDRTQEDARITLSWGAKEILMIPVLETIESKGYAEWGEIEYSIQRLVNTMAESPDYLDDEVNDQYSKRKKRNSISLIRGFHENFCNIPPFCARR
jgi:hypothetical protein